MMWSYFPPANFIPEEIMFGQSLLIQSLIIWQDQYYFVLFLKGQYHHKWWLDIILFLAFLSSATTFYSYLLSSIIKGRQTYRFIHSLPLTDKKINKNKSTNIVQMNKCMNCCLPLQSPDIRFAYRHRVQLLSCQPSWARRCDYIFPLFYPNKVPRRGTQTDVLLPVVSWKRRSKDRSPPGIKHPPRRCRCCLSLSPHTSKRRLLLCVCANSHRAELPRVSRS